MIQRKYRLILGLVLFLSLLAMSMVVDAGQSGREIMDMTGKKVKVPLKVTRVLGTDIIIAMSRQGKEAIMKNPAWGVINAVRKNQVYVNPKGIYSWCVRSADEALQVLWAAKTFHPELFPDIDIVKEVKWFHQKFYNDNMSDEDVQHMLRALPPK